MFREVMHSGFKNWQVVIGAFEHTSERNLSV